MNSRWFLFISKRPIVNSSFLKDKESRKEDSGCRTNLFEGILNHQLWYFCYISNAQQPSSTQTTCRGQTLGTVIACSPGGVSKLQKLFLLIKSSGLTAEPVEQNVKESPKLQEFQPISTKFNLQTNISVWKHPHQRAHSGSALSRIRPVENDPAEAHARTHTRPEFHPPSDVFFGFVNTTCAVKRDKIQRRKYNLIPLENKYIYKSAANINQGYLAPVSGAPSISSTSIQGESFTHSHTIYAPLL